MCRQLQRRLPNSTFIGTDPFYENNQFHGWIMSVWNRKILAGRGLRFQSLNISKFHNLWQFGAGFAQMLNYILWAKVSKSTKCMSETLWMLWCMRSLLGTKVCAELQKRLQRLSLRQLLNMTYAELQMVLLVRVGLPGFLLQFSMSWTCHEPSFPLYDS